MFKVFSENDVFVAGYGLGASGSFAKRYNGTSWTNVTYGATYSSYLLDVALHGTNVYSIAGNTAGGVMGLFLGRPCLNGVVDYDLTNTLKAVAVDDNGKAYAVGQGGLILSYGNGSWTAEASGTTNDLMGVAAGGGWVCAVGRNRTILCKQDGGAWSAASGLTTRNENKFLGVAHSGDGTFVAILNTGNDGSSTYIGADKGTLYKISAGSVTLLRTGMSTELGGIGASASGKIVTAGRGGVVYGNPIVPLAQQITFPSPGDQLTTNRLGLSVSASSGLQVSCRVVSGDASISGYTNLSFTGAGPVVIEATQAGNADWAAATPRTNSITVTKAVADVTLNGLSQVVSNTYPVTASTIPTNLAVSITYDGSAAVPTEIGSYTITGLVSEVMYQGSATGTLIIAAQTRILALSGSLSFGSVVTNKSRTHTLTVSNTGNSLLTVTGITVTPDTFTATPTNFTVAAGGSQEVTVTFTPNAEAPYSGTLTITSDATSGTTSQSVTGKGCAGISIIPSIQLLLFDEKR